jgi:hypothetical protein
MNTMQSKKSKSQRILEVSIWRFSPGVVEEDAFVFHMYLQPACQTLPSPSPLSTVVLVLSYAYDDRIKLILVRFLCFPLQTYAGNAPANKLLSSQSSCTHFGNGSKH